MLESVSVVLDLPPVVVQVFQVERVHAVLLLRFQHLADLVLVFVLERRLVGSVHAVARLDVQPPMVKHVAGMDRVADFHAHNVKAHTQANRHRRFGVAAALQAEELLVELAGRLQAVAFQSAMSQAEGLHERIALRDGHGEVRGNGVLDVDFHCVISSILAVRSSRSAQAAAFCLSASLMKESA